MRGIIPIWQISVTKRNDYGLGSIYNRFNWHSFVQEEKVTFDTKTLKKNCLLLVISEAEKFLSLTGNPRDLLLR